MNRLQHRERRVTQILLLLFDGVALFLAFYMALNLRFSHNSIYHIFRRLFDASTFGSFFDHSRFLIIYALLVFSFYLFDLYEPRHWRARIFSPLRMILGTLLCALLSFACFYFFTEQTRGMFGRGVFLGAIFLFVPFSLGIRYLIEMRERSKRKRQAWLFIGAADDYEKLRADLQRVDFGGFLEHRNFSLSSTELFSLLAQDWTGVVVGPHAPKDLNNHLMKARLKGLSLLSLQSFYEFHCGKIPVHSLDDAWFAFTEGFFILHSPMSVRMKRVTDIVLSIVFMIIALPIMLITIVLVRLESRGSVFFKQKRVGISGKSFTMWKVRSMCHDAEKEGAQWAAAKDVRVTRIGRVIRKTRIDELPQLWNILIGDMSFVGPRPERPEFTSRLAERIPFYDFRHLVKPGLTGWAQVMYPYGASEEDAREKLQYELFYIKNYSFDLDLEIVFRTVTVVLFGAGR